MDILKSIRMAVDTGKVVLGAKESLRCALNGEGQVFVVANNCPKDVRSDIEYYVKLSNLKLLNFEGSNKELAQACGKPYFVSVLAVLEPGDSNILNVK